MPSVAHAKLWCSVVANSRNKSSSRPALGYATLVKCSVSYANQTCVDKGCVLYNSVVNLCQGAVGGTIYKVGTGTLALGGELKFLNYSDPYGAVTNTWRLYSPNGSNETVRTYGDVYERTGLMMLVR